MEGRSFCVTEKNLAKKAANLFDLPGEAIGGLPSLEITGLGRIESKIIRTADLQRRTHRSRRQEGCDKICGSDLDTGDDGGIADYNRRNL